jgi:mRNA interferase RelE/StbE
MAWRVLFDARAEREFNKLSFSTQEEILTYLRKRVLAAENPRSFGKALRGDKSGLWRYRVGKYRIICELRDKTLVIMVVNVGKRDSVYD